MKKSRFIAALLILGCVSFPHRSPAPIVVRDGEGTSYVAPGAQEVPNQKDAQTQFDTAFAKENAGDIGSAIAGYRKTVRRFPRSTVASAAQYKMSALLEKHGDITGATKGYEKLIKDYPKSADFNNALEGVFRIGNLWLEGAKQKILGLPTFPSMEKAVSAYAIIITNAPFSKYAPLAQFNVGQAREKQSDYKAAIVSYQVVVDKYPSDPVAADSQYQIAFCYMQISRQGSNDRIAAQRARENFEDFLATYPNNEKAAQAKEDLNALALQQTGGSMQIARYYDRQKLYRAAIVYYNDVIRQQPNSPDSEAAKARLDQLRTKLGDAVFNEGANVTSPTAAAGASPAAKKPTDGRLQAQTDTARRSDYAGPPVSAPSPPPSAPVAAGSAGVPLPPPASGSGGEAPRPETTPPPVPEGDQPSLPSQ